jgi:hypothetical protein
MPAMSGSDGQVPSSYGESKMIPVDMLAPGCLGARISAAAADSMASAEIHPMVYPSREREGDPCGRMLAANFFRLSKAFTSLPCAQDTGGENPCTATKDV